MSDDPSLWEIWRTVRRIEDSLTPLVSLPARMERTEDDVKVLTNKVDGIQTKTLFTAGLISGAGAVLNFFFGRHG